MEHRAVHAHLALVEIDVEVPRTRHARPPHPARHERRVAGLAALARDDPRGGEEARHVVGLRERPDEHHRAPVLRRVDRFVGSEDDLALGGARRRVHPAREHLVLGVGGERGVQQAVERAGVDRRDRLLAGEEALAHSVDRAIVAATHVSVKRVGLANKA